jgi:hypothetical protein
VPYSHAEQNRGLSPLLGGGLFTYFAGFRTCLSGRVPGLVGGFILLRASVKGSISALKQRLNGIDDNLYFYNPFLR